MERRPLGQTGDALSVVGFGGVVVMDSAPADAERNVARAIERGVTYFDVAPSYGDAEDRLGPALQPYRDSVFLACKTLERSRDGAWKELRSSLKKLRTDHFDLYQLHAVNKLEEVDQVFGPGGAIETLLEAREQGLVRHLGFSAHDEDTALAMIQRFAFDTVLFPLNWTSWHAGGFGPRLFAAAKERGMGILALKSLSKCRLEKGRDRVLPKCWYVPVESREEAALALRFTLSLPVTAAVSPGEVELLWWECEAAEVLTPLSEQEAAMLEKSAREVTPVFPLPAGA